MKKYFISKANKEELVPEETLIDSTSLHSKVEAPVRRGVFAIFYAVIFLLAIAVGVRSFNLQIMNGDYYASLAERNSFTRYYTASLRGVIMSADGEALAKNRPIFDVVALTSRLPKDEEGIAEYAEILSGVMGINKDELLDNFNRSKNKAVFVLVKDLDKELVLKLEQKNIPGIFTVVNYGRQYADGHIFSQVLGYISGVGEADLGDGFYISGDRIGRAGVEEQYEEYLRGQRGAVYFRSDDGGVIVEEPMQGNTVELNIDFMVQEKLFEALNEVLRSQGLRSGAAVVQDSKTGEIKALVSLPTYDNNIFDNYFNEASAKQVEAVFKDRSRPLFNRIISGKYSPGSTIKPLFALAGLKEGIVNTSTIIYSSGAINVRSDVDPNVFFTFRDWKVHGWTDIYKAIADSVDVFFYALGGGYENISGLGIDRIYKYLSGAMADKILGVDMPGEASGLVPSREWKKLVKNEPWYKGDTYNVSIGQGDLLVTPLWINSYISAIANGGDIMKPIVVNRILTPEGEIVLENKPEKIGALDFDEDTLNIVRRGMKQTVESGTGKLLESVPVTLAAKTGTAQITGSQLNSLLTVFGPYEDPEITLTIIVETIGDQQGLALRVAKSFLEWYFDPNRN
ncbi:MAG: penicillin-binding transpeptidase domain-containing protein [bacterium]|nr:penicillin-binding transpeptidase domain-containing protein [bacterium]